MKANGLYIFVAWNILHVNPPLITTKSQIDDIFKVSFLLCVSMHYIVNILPH